MDDQVLLSDLLDSDLSPPILLEVPDSAPLHLGKQVLDYTGQGLHLLLSEHLGIEPGLFHISFATKNITLSTRPLAEEGVEPGCTLRFLGHLAGGSQKSIKSFLTEETPPKRRPPARPADHVPESATASSTKRKARKHVEKAPGPKRRPTLQDTISSYLLTTNSSHATLVPLPSSRTITALTWNASSLDPKTQPTRSTLLRDLISSHSPDIIAIQETRTPAIGLPGYASIPYSFSDSHAGTAILIKEELAWRKSIIHSRALEDIPHVEASVVGLNHGSGEYLVGSCYVNPKAPPRSIFLLLDYIMSYGITLIGDFNARDAFNDHDNHNPAGKAIDKFIEKNPSLLTTFPDDPTFRRSHEGPESYASTLDGLLSGDPLISCPPCSTLYPLDSDHLPVQFVLSW